MVRASDLWDTDSKLPGKIYQLIGETSLFPDVSSKRSWGFSKHASSLHSRFDHQPAMIFIFKASSCVQVCLVCLCNIVSQHKEASTRCSQISYWGASKTYTKSYHFVKHALEEKRETHGKYSIVANACSDFRIKRKGLVIAIAQVLICVSVKPIISCTPQYIETTPSHQCQAEIGQPQL